MATALAHSIAAVAPPRARAARSRLVRPVRARVRVAASAGDDAEVTPERRLQLEKADALREEYDGVSTRARRLLKRGSRLAEKIDELTAGAERAMTLGADRDENQARRLLRERAQVKEALDRTIARAEVLKELARKIELAIIVYAGDIADAPEAPTDPKQRRLVSLEAEFASLEINVLERAFAASGSEREATAPRKKSDGEARSATGDQTEGEKAKARAERGAAVPGWWRSDDDDDASVRTRDDAKKTTDDVEKPLDALLSLDRARVSSVGVRPSDAVRLRVACAAHGAENVAGSKRLEGGKRDTAFRAGVEAAVAAVEAEEGEEKSSESVFFWRSLGGQEPLRFLSDLARDLGVRPARAGALVTEAIVRRVEKTLVQCAAHARAGDWEDARRECETLARSLAAFAAAVASPEDRERVSLVALRTQRQLREDERREVLALFSNEGREGESVREVVALALGLEEERKS